MTDKSNPLGLETFDSVQMATDNPDFQEILMQEAFESGDEKFIAHTLNVVSKARGMSSTARQAGITRQTLHKVCSAKGSPSLKSLLGILSSLGFEMTVRRRQDISASKPPL